MTSSARVSAAVAAGGAERQAQPAGESYASKLQTARDAINDGRVRLREAAACRKSTTIRPRPARMAAETGPSLRRSATGARDLQSRGGGREEQEARTRRWPAIRRLKYSSSQLDVDTTTDPETLGLWSAIHKRRAEMPGRTLDQQKADVEKAVRAAERGFMIKNDYYNGTNLAYLFNLRASLSSGDDRIADNVFADRVRRMVVKITDERLATLDSQKADPAEARPLEEERYWIAATKAESLVALGDPSGRGLMDTALASAPAGWMADTTRNQLEKLHALLAKARP